MNSSDLDIFEARFMDKQAAIGLVHEGCSAFLVYELGMLLLDIYLGARILVTGRSMFVLGCSEISCLARQMA